MRILVGVLALLAPHPLYAHGGNPAEALVTAPRMVGTIADESFTITWIDSDLPIPTGTAAVNLFYTDAMPPTFFPGSIPDSIAGTPIAEGIREVDTANRFVWDTTLVASGTYWIWSRVDEPPEPVPSPIYLSFSPAPLHVQHPGDPLGPSVRITRPNTDISYSDQEFELRWEAFAPNGPATIRLEAGTTIDGTDFMVIADGLAATSTGSFVWDTRGLAEMDWTIRAVITDETGSFTAYSPYFLLITHFFPNRDAGVRDAAPTLDAAIPPVDAGTPIPPPEEGCSCRAVRSRSACSSAAWPEILLAWIAIAAAVCRSGCRTSSAITRRKPASSSTLAAARRSKRSPSPPPPPSESR